MRWNGKTIRATNIQTPGGGVYTVYTNTFWVYTVYSKLKPTKILHDDVLFFSAQNNQNCLVITTADCKFMAEQCSKYQIIYLKLNIQKGVNNAPHKRNDCNKLFSMPCINTEIVVSVPKFHCHFSKLSSIWMVAHNQVSRLRHRFY